MIIGGWHLHHLIRKSTLSRAEKAEGKSCQQSRRNLIKGTESLPPAGNSFDWETIPDYAGAKYKTFPPAYFKHCECVSATFRIKVTRKSLTELLPMFKSGLNVAFYYISLHFFLNFLTELYPSYLQLSYISIQIILSKLHFCKIVAKFNVFSLKAAFQYLNTFPSLYILAFTLGKELNRYFYSEVFFAPLSVLMNMFWRSWRRGN